MPKNKPFYINYFNLSCRVYCSEEWKKYFRKMYSASSLISFSELQTESSLMATLDLIEEKSNVPKMEFVADENDLFRYEIRVSNFALFFFLSVHQLIARIFNILFHLDGGLVLHASSILFNDKAYIFAGHSGRGKSTLVDFFHEKYKDSTILSDNSAFIRKEENKFLLHPSPYLESNRIFQSQKTLNLNKAFEIDAVYFPFHGLKNEISELSFSEKTTLIQQNSHIPYSPEVLFKDNKELRKIFAKNFFLFTNNVPIYKLAFLKDPSVIGKIVKHRQ